MPSMPTPKKGFPQRALAGLLPAGQTPSARMPGGRFRLMRYVVLTSLVALVFFMVLMYFTEHMEESFFADVQHNQLQFFDEVQTGFMREADQARQAEILKIHEAGHVNLAHVFANLLWEPTLAPLVSLAEQIPIAHCRALAPPAGMPRPYPPQQACFAKVQQHIMALPRFREVDATVRSTIRKSSVFKIKVFDRRGLTVYSSEAAQVGEDKADNQGWQRAASGQAASELTHRARFSAFEGVVEDRDLISSYLPILDASQQVQGVFEIYSDATPFLKASGEAAQAMAQRINANRATASAVARANLERITVNNGYAQAISALLFGLFYAALLLIVFNGQRILDQHVLAQERANERERLWHREKMQALATMAANVAHEVGNPLASITALTQELATEQHAQGCTHSQPGMILEQTDRIARMTRQIVNFATLRDQEPEAVDVNQMVGAVCDFLGFDPRFRAVRLETQWAPQLPAWVAVPEHLNEALMLVLQSCLEQSLHAPLASQRLRVQTQDQGDALLIRLDFGTDTAPPSDYAWALATRRLTDLGARLTQQPGSVAIWLPTPATA